MIKINWNKIAFILGGRIKEEQREVLDYILDEVNKQNITIEQSAYILGTIYHETQLSFQPLNKIKNDIFYSFIPINLNWRGLDRYKEIIGISFTQYSSNRHILQFIITSMSQGLFTGQSLNKHINNIKKDYIQARRILNGIDCADKIKNYTESILLCLYEE